MCAFRCLLGFFFLGWACSQTTDSCGDATAHLQFLKVPARAAGLSQQNATLDPCLSDINTGVCESTSAAAECLGCDGGATIPSNAYRFNRALLCKNDGNPDGACTMRAESSPAYEFANANDVLECTGGACDGFKLNNVGAVCCSGHNSCAGGAEFSMASAGACTKDVCCDGTYSTCYRGKFEAVNSMSCVTSCQAATVSLSGDLHCSGYQACDGAWFTFQPGEQCVRCVDGACRSTTLDFLGRTAHPSNVLCQGTGACDTLSMTISYRNNVRLYCTGSSSCYELSVQLIGSLSLYCDGPGACEYAEITKDGGDCSCTVLNGGKCPENCQEAVTVEPPARCVNAAKEDFDEDTACCSGPGGCGECGCEPPTTAACLQDINTGVCESTAAAAGCLRCDGGDTIPSNADGFPDGSLLCRNEGTLWPACTMKNASSPAYKFGNEADFLECTGGACNGFKVENVGAVCCTGSGSCESSEISMASAGPCMKDVCCHDSACQEAELQVAKSLSCTGGSCANTEVELLGDLYCSGAGGCTGAHFSFQSANQCIRCLDGACGGTTFVFQPTCPEPGSTTSNVFCTSSEACANSHWTILSKSARFHCEGRNSCKGMDVELSGSLSLFCDGDSACAATTIRKHFSGLCNCTAINGGKCPEDCQDAVVVEPPARCVNEAQEDFDADTACCSGPGGCGDCGCDATTTTTTSTPVASGEANGDPHMLTLDGHRYLLLKQGTFSLWQFTGMDAELMAYNFHKKRPVDFKIYAHYSGHASYTKGLLVLDSSGANRMALEMTSQDCQWRSKTSDAWNVINGTQLLSVPDGDGEDMTALNVVQTAGKTRVEFLLKEVTGFFRSVANLFVRCNPSHFMNVKMSMPQREVHLVEGQLGPRDGGRGELGELSPKSFLQEEVGRRDQEFETLKTWRDLGGSSAAASYLELVDEQGTAFLQTCGDFEMEKAKAACAKYLGEAPSASSQFAAAFENCAYDVCHGGGEIAAQLAAEIWNAK